MSRTYKSTGHIEIDEDDGTRYYQKPQCCSDRHSINASKVYRTNKIWPYDLRDFGMQIRRTNRTRDAFYESCHYQIKDWEKTRYDTERTDAIAMEKEWRRAQWKAQMEE